MITKTRWKNLDALSLENDALRVIVLPALGGKLASVFHKKKNFELAAQNQEAFYHLPHVGDDFPDMMLPAWMMPFRVSIPASRKLWPPFCRRSRFLTAPIRTTEKSGAVP